MKASYFSSIVFAIVVTGLFASCEASLRNPNDPGSAAWTWTSSTIPSIVPINSDPFTVAGAETWLGPVVVRLDTVDGSSISYTVDGSVPSKEHGERVSHGATITMNHSCELRAIALETGKAPSSEAQRSFTIFPLIHSWNFEDGDPAWSGDGLKALTVAISEGYLHGVWNVSNPTAPDPRIWSEQHELDPIDTQNLRYIELNMRSSFPWGTITFMRYTVSGGKGTQQIASSLTFSPPSIPTDFKEMLFDVADAAENTTHADYWRNGSLQQMRVDPSNATTGFVSGLDFDIDFIRFYGDAE